MKQEPSDTRKRLLGAAVNEFAEKGFAGARIDTVAREAKVNKRMIYHYFKSKQGIWDCIVEGEYWETLTPEQKVRLQLWKLLASDLPITSGASELTDRTVEITEMQSQGLIRNDVDPLSVAALEQLVLQAPRLCLTKSDGLPNPVIQLTELLSRLLRPRIRLKPRVVTV